MPRVASPTACKWCHTMRVLHSLVTRILLCPHCDYVCLRGANGRCEKCNDMERSRRG